MNKYGEPWRYVPPVERTLTDEPEIGWLTTASGLTLATVDYMDAAAQEALRHIAACVNACAGLTDEQLAGGVIAVESVKQMVVGMTPSKAEGVDEWTNGYRAALRHVLESLAEIARKGG